MSLRLSGAMFSLNKTLQKWKIGNRAARVKFRQYDYILSMQDPLNDFLEAQDSMLQRIETINQEIHEMAYRNGQKEIHEKTKEIMILFSKEKQE